MDSRGAVDGVHAGGAALDVPSSAGPVAAAAVAAGWQPTDASSEEARGDSSAEASSSGLPEEIRSLRGDTLIVFDWDDTILPTSWLEHTNALGGIASMKPQFREQVEALCKASADTLRLAYQLGTVIIVTNSSPGWVDQSCKLFMPQLMPELRGMKCVAKPMAAPITFKIGAFKRECRHYTNIVSIGDGDPERMACLKLQSPPERLPRGKLEEDPLRRRVKSVKLVEAPTCAQLIIEHDMLQNRLMDIVGHGAHLDLRARFMASRASGASAATAVCILGQFSTLVRSTPMALRSAGHLPPLGSGDEEWSPHKAVAAPTAMAPRQQPSIQPQAQAQPPQQQTPQQQQVGQTASPAMRPPSSNARRRVVAPELMDRGALSAGGDDDWLAGKASPDAVTPKSASWSQAQQREQPPDFPPTPKTRPPSSPGPRRRNESTPSLLDRGGFATGGDDGWLPIKQQAPGVDDSWILMKKPANAAAKRPGTSGGIVGGGRGSAGVGIGGSRWAQGHGDSPGASTPGGFIMPADGPSAAAAVRSGLGVYKMDSGTSASNRLRMSAGMKQPGRSYSSGTLAPAGGARRHHTSLLTGHRLG